MPSSFKMTIKPMATLSNSTTIAIPYELKKGQNRLSHKLPSGLKMEVIEQRKDKADNENPLLVFVHGSYHAAWCWAEHWLPFFSSSGFDSYAISLLGQLNSQFIKVLIFILNFDFRPMLRISPFNIRIQPCPIWLSDSDQDLSVWQIKP